MNSGISRLEIEAAEARSMLMRSLSPAAIGDAKEAFLQSQSRDSEATVIEDLAAVRQLSEQSKSEYGRSVLDTPEVVSSFQMLKRIEEKNGF